MAQWRHWGGQMKLFFVGELTKNTGEFNDVGRWEWWRDGGWKKV